MSRAGRLFLAAIALAAIGATAVALALATAARSVTLAVPAADELLALCGRLLWPALSPAGVLVLGLAVFSTVVVTRGARSLVSQLRGRRRYHRALRTLGEANVAGTTITRIGDPRPEAFCSGYLRPRIYVSTGALELLGPSEVEAVVAHERHHATRRDPLRLLALRVLAEAFFFLPALRSLTRRYEALGEVAADEAALRTADRQTLASALLRFGATSHPEVVVGIAPERVDHLLGRAPGWRLPIALVLASVAALLGLLVVTLLAAELVGGSEVDLTTVLARSCMLVMVALPAVILVSLLVGRAERRGQASAA